MKKFIPKEKLSKKARKQLDSEQRTTWSFSPVTKKVESKKLYSRKRKAHDRYDDYGMGFLNALERLFLRPDNPHWRGSSGWRAFESTGSGLPGTA